MRREKLKDEEYEDFACLTCNHDVTHRVTEGNRCVFTCPNANCITDAVYRLQKAIDDDANRL